MGIQVYQEDNYRIYKTGHNFIIHNSDYAFKEKHSHVRNFNTAKKIIYYVKHEIVPRNISPYLLTSLTRIADNAHYIDEIEQLMETRSQKGLKPKYCNKS